ncbi:MAG TPA: hypothetical protein VH000_11140 [Rhizomicrobium sp.]|nr:hypothetical protein [Rhizomicrobium sp.]
MIIQIGRVIVPATLGLIFSWLLVRQMRAGDIAVRNVGFQRDGNPLGFWCAAVLWAFFIVAMAYLSAIGLLRML